MDDKSYKVNIREYRKAEHDINPLFLKRWSPRAMSGESISDEELFSLLEAARWAPSSYNNQPWRFIYAKRDTKEWNKLFDLMYEPNQAWAKNAAVLFVVVSKKTFENGKEYPTHKLEAGSAWQNLALQAANLSLVAHGMGGFDFEKARKDLNVPSEFDVEMMIAVGKHGKTEDLPKGFKEGEKPSSRMRISEFSFKGSF